MTPSPRLPPWLLLPLAAGLITACSDYELTKSDKPSGADDSGPAGDSGEVDLCPDETPPGPPGFSVDESCVVETEPGEFDPTVEWQWSSHATFSGYHQIMATPSVGNLTDDDGDGVIDEDDIPEVVFTSFAGSAYTSPGVITAISGDSGAEVWSLSSAGGYGVYSSAGVAIGDLEGDGLPDVCTAGSSTSVVCLEHDGTFKWAAGSTPYYVGCPAIADLDGDGQAEVIFGDEIFASDGTLLGKGGLGVGGRYTSFAVDMDGDGQLEVVAGRSVYELDGTLVWDDGLSDGIPAVGDFDADGQPEVVRTASSTLILTDTDGTVLWQVSVPGGGGGAPTVADYDGDGEPEVGVAGLSYYTLFDTDGSILWSNSTEDDSSSVTGSSVFDFDRDGAAEVVYADEHTLYVYDGATGSVRLAMDGHASATLFEYPVIADVDRDGSTEIIVASNNYAWSGWNGITVIGDLSGSWAPARPIWNQFAYHITNVENDGAIPKVQDQNWLTWNNFRAGGTEEGPSDWLADLEPGRMDACLEECAEDRVTFYLSVGNSGLRTAEASTALVSSPIHGELFSASVPALPSGEAAWIGPFEVERADWGGDPLNLTVDVDGEVEECDEDDNKTSIGAWPCD